MQICIENPIEVSPGFFWRSLFFDEAYNRTLYDRLGFASLDVTLFEREANGDIRRNLRATPAFEAPAPIRRLTEGVLGYSEEGRFHAEEQIWRFRTVPSVMAERIRISGHVRLEELPRGALHVCTVDMQVNIWGLSNRITRTLEKNLRRSYEELRLLTNRYAAEAREGAASADGPLQIS